MAQSPREVAISYFRAEEGRDIDRILRHYAEDAVFIPATGPVQGREAIRPFYVDSATRFPGLEVGIPRVLVDGERVAAEWDAWFTDPGGERFNLVGVNMFVIRDGQIVESRAYYDTAGFYGGHVES